MENLIHPIGYNKAMSTKNKLVFIGSSHAKRLCHEAYYIEEITNEYKILDFSRPGSLFENLTWPERSTLTDKDVIIFQSFGNNLMQRHTVHIRVMEFFIYQNLYQINYLI